MNIDYRKLLPLNIKETRWGELASVIQSIFTDIRTEKINPIKDQKNVGHMTNQELIDFCYMLGYNVVSLDGYTFSTQYLFRQAKTLQHRIKKKTTRKAYKSIGYIYDLVGEAYPMSYDNILLTLHPVKDYYEIINSWSAGLSEFDRELTSDGLLSGKPVLYFDESPDWFFDQSGLNNLLTRHIIFCYTNYFIEEEDKFLSRNTSKALYYDLKFVNRATEVIYVEPTLEIDVTSDNNVTSKTYISYDGLISIDYDSILIGTDFKSTNEIITIKFGNGKHSNLATLTSGSDIEGDVVYNLDMTDESQIKEYDWDDTRFNVAKAITEYCKIEPITEVGLFDSSGLVCYCTFPEVNFYYKLHANIALDINII